MTQDKCLFDRHRFKGSDINYGRGGGAKLGEIYRQNFVIESTWNFVIPPISTDRNFVIPPIQDMP